MTKGEMVLGLFANMRRIEIGRLMHAVAATALARNPLADKDLLIEGGIDPRTIARMEVEQFKAEGLAKTAAGMTGV